MYDIPVVHYYLGKNRDLRWIGKQELLKVPLFGQAFGVSRHIAIDRQRRHRGIAALKQAAAESAEGVSFVIMPEGTRSRDARLLPFKRGPFHLAIDTGLPILPVAIAGSETMMRKGTWWILPGTIDLTVLPPIPVTGLGKDSIDDLSDRVREVIRAALPDEPGGGGAGKRERSDR
jgi:1-acyl-sn-glycerol-3-phosphate acyltransferase